MSMNVQKVLTTAHRIVLTLLVATSVSAMMDMLWTLTNTHAMVSFYMYNLKVFFTLLLLKILMSVRKEHQSAT